MILQTQENLLIIILTKVTPTLTPALTLTQIDNICEFFYVGRPGELASCLIYARTLLEYVIIIMWLRSVIKMLRSVKFAEDKALTFFILREKC